MIVEDLYSAQIDLLVEETYYAWINLAVCFCYLEGGLLKDDSLTALNWPSNKFSKSDHQTTLRAVLPP